MVYNYIFENNTLLKETVIIILVIIFTLISSNVYHKQDISQGTENNGSSLNPCSQILFKI